MQTGRKDPPRETESPEGGRLPLAQAFNDLSAAFQIFNGIIFNFPHTGQQRVHMNRALLRSVLRTNLLD